jgi:hypothetical protein
MPSKNVLILTCLAFWLGHLVSPTSAHAGFVSSIDGVLEPSGAEYFDRSSSGVPVGTSAPDINRARSYLERVLGNATAYAIPGSGGSQMGGSSPVDSGPSGGAVATVDVTLDLSSNKAVQGLRLSDFVWIPPAFLSGIFRPPRMNVA